MLCSSETHTLQSLPSRTTSRFPPRSDAGLAESHVLAPLQGVSGFKAPRQLESDLGVHKSRTLCGFPLVPTGSVSHVASLAAWLEVEVLLRGLCEGPRTLAPVPADAAWRRLSGSRWIPLVARQNLSSRGLRGHHFHLDSQRASVDTSMLYSVQ